MDGLDSRRAAGNGRTGENGPATPPPAQLTDRQLLEELAAVGRRLQPLIDAAERHPLIRALLRRI